MLTIFDDDAWQTPAPGGYAGTLGDGVEALWFDLYAHGDDIRDAIGRPSERGDGLRPTVSHIATELTKRGWGPATLALDGLPEFPVGDGTGLRIDGDPLQFMRRDRPRQRCVDGPRRRREHLRPPAAGALQNPGSANGSASFGASTVSSSTPSSAARPFVARALELVGELGAAAGDDAARHQHVHPVGRSSVSSA